MALKPWITFENAIQYTFLGFFGAIILAGTSIDHISFSLLISGHFQWYVRYSSL